MKLSEIPLRDWFAGQALAGIVARGENRSKDQAWRAYEIADAMLAQMSFHAHEIAALTRRAEKAELTLSVIQQASADALSEIYQMLGVDNQAAAMQVIRGLYDEIREWRTGERKPA